MGFGEAAHHSLPLGVPESGLPALRRGKRPEDVLPRVIPKGQITTAVVDPESKHVIAGAVPQINLSTLCPGRRGKHHLAITIDHFEPPSLDHVRQQRPDRRRHRACGDQCHNHQRRERSIPSRLLPARSNLPLQAGHPLFHRVSCKSHEWVSQAQGRIDTSSSTLFTASNRFDSPTPPL